MINLKINPDYRDLRWYQKRLNLTMNFMSELIIQGKEVLSTNNANEFDQFIADKFNLNVEYTTLDMDQSHWFINIKHLRFDYIFCFEVIEHLLNPLQFLNNVKRFMNLNSILFITYPINNRALDCHFNEYDKERFNYMINKAGLKVIKYKQIIQIRSMLRLKNWILPFTKIPYFSKRQFYALSRIS